jgi:hypothetical protein
MHYTTSMARLLARCYSTKTPHTHHNDHTHNRYKIQIDECPQTSILTPHFTPKLSVLHPACAEANALALGPVMRGEVLKEILRGDHRNVLFQRLHLEVLLKRDIFLQGYRSIRSQGTYTKSVHVISKIHGHTYTMLVAEGFCTFPHKSTIIYI